MASVYFRARFRFSVAEATSVSWLYTTADSNGDNYIQTAFALSQDMTDSVQRATVFNALEVQVLGYGGSIVTSTDSWNLVGGDYIWIVDIESTTPTSPSSVGTRIIWAANLCTGIGDYMFPVTWTECDTPPTPPIDTTPCDICYDVTTDPCESTIFLPGLDADTTYTLTMTDNNAGVSYNYEVTTDETGEASVIIADFPVGAFSTFSNYTVTIVDENGDPAQVTIGYTTYDCYNLIFTPSTTVTPQG